MGGVTGGDPRPMTPAERSIRTSMDSPEGPVEPKDSVTVFTRIYDDVKKALKISNVGVGGTGGVAAPKLATIRVPAAGTIAVGGSSNFEITLDVDGNLIPNTIYVPQIVIVPTAATIFRARLFATSARALAGPMWYQSLFGAMDEDYANDATGFWFFNRDGTLRNRIFGQMSIDAGGSNAAAFDIFLLLFEGI